MTCARCQGCYKNNQNKIKDSQAPTYYVHNRNLRLTCIYISLTDNSKDDQENTNM